MSRAPLDRISVIEEAARDAERPALVTDEGVISYGALADAVALRVASLPEAATSLGIVARNDVDTIVTLLACLERGLAAVLLHASAPDAVRATQADAAKLSAIWDAGALTQTGREPDRFALNRRTAVAVFTSGSSGVPKGVQLSAKGLRASAEASATNLGWEADDRWLLTLPLAHVGGLSIVIRCVLGGAAVVLSDRALPEAVATHDVTLLSLVPTQLRRMLAAPGAGPAKLRAVLVGGAACPPTLAREARNAGIPVLLTWGMSEAGSQIATQPLEQALTGPDDRVGEPLAGWAVRLNGPTALVRGDAAMLGYFPRRAHRSCFKESRWLDTGDRVEQTPTGLRVLGRARDLIISGGENVSPSRLADALAAYPAVAEAHVIGVPDLEWGHAVCAVVVWRDGEDAEGLDAWCRDTLPPWERPKRWAFVESMPELPNGKRDVAALRALLDDAGA